MIDSVSNEGGSKRAGRLRKPAPPVDRLLPHSPEAEVGVLGCILMSPKESLSDCVAQFKGNTEVFYDLRNQIIYQEMVAMADEMKPIDVITVMQQLKDNGQLERIGGMAYLAGLPDQVPSAANLSYYTAIVWEKYLLRKTLQTFADKTIRIYEYEGEVEALLDEVEADILKINENRSVSELRSMSQLMTQAVHLVEDMQRGVGLISGIRTRFGYFDKMTGGLHRKELIVLAGRPSLGKTSLAINIAQNIAKIEGLAVGVFSMEMSSDDLALRMWCAEASVNFHKLRTGFVSAENLESMFPIATRVAKLPIHIDDTPALSILELRAKARRMAHRFNCQVFVIDYLQLMHSTNERANNREQEIADISSGLKAMAKELNVPVVVLSQLNREAEKRKYAKPQLSDLRESGAIEQDADLVGILYKPKSESEEDEDGDVIRTNLHIAKQRNGPTGDAEFIFQRWCMRFEDAYLNRGKAPEQTPGISAVTSNDD